MGWLITDYGEVFDDRDGKLIEKNGYEIPMTVEQLRDMRLWREEQESETEAASPALEQTA
ncbi:hypothetical protein DMP23_05005 [Amycolatopsis sp. A1MSW2902]